MNEVNYKTLEETELSIERLMKIEWPDISNITDHEAFIKEVETLLYNEFDYIPITLRINEKFDLPLFRARDLGTFTNVNLFQEHSLPPLNLSSSQRCNFAKHPVFYCSVNPLTAVFEVIRNNNYAAKKYCISKWSILDGPDIANQSFLQVPLPETNDFINLRDNEKEKVKKIFGRNLNSSQVDGLIKYIEFLHKIFVSDNYALSATLSHKSFFGKTPINADIIIYPSLQTDSVTANFAIHPNFVTQRLTLNRIYVVEIINYERANKKFDISISKFGRIEKNKIIWEDPISENYLKAYAEDFEFMVAK